MHEDTKQPKSLCLAISCFPPGILLHVSAMLARELRSDRIRSNDLVIQDLQSYQTSCIQHLLRVEATFYVPRSP